jgi:adenylosuccinate synthase
MPSTIIVGGQYGSEGKGKVVALTAGLCREPFVVRCGGPNSGHTVWIRNERVVLRQVPAGVGNPNALLLLSPGCAVDEDILLDEVNRLALPRERIVVDPRTVLVTPRDKDTERSIVEGIASTGSGTGAALIRRMSRASDVRLAGGSERLRSRVRVESVAPLLHSNLDRGGKVIVEGTQGFGLSLLHGPHYPHVTSRDTTAAGFASEAGLSPRQVHEIILVIRTFPIRVGGASGPFADEITWEEVRELSGAPRAFLEFTSVTNKLRRVARFDMEAVRVACRYNRPTSLALMGLDRLDHGNHGVKDVQQLTTRSLSFIRELEEQTGVSIAWLGTGFETSEAINVRGFSNGVVPAVSGPVAILADHRKRDRQSSRGSEAVPPQGQRDVSPAAD